MSRPHDSGRELPDLPVRAEPLRPFVAAGVLGPAEVHLADTFSRLAGVTSPEEMLALAVAARAPRFGHVGVRPGEAHRLVVDRYPNAPVEGADQDAPEELPWPAAGAWAEALAASPVVAAAEDADTPPLRPLVLDRGRLYLHRHWSDERLVAERLVERARRTRPVDVDRIEAALRRVVGTQADVHGDAQVEAVRRALSGHLAVVVGGPGTGKTRTVARLLAAALVLRHEGPAPTIAAGDRELQVALAAPTGKAAARMTDAVRRSVEDGADDGGVLEASDVVRDQLGGIEATTVHRLLGVRPDGTFRHDGANPLPHDLVVVDEASMVALPLMARLLDAVRPDARLVLVGDPDQLVSVEAGSVLADVVAAADDPSGTSALAPCLVRLHVVHRFGAQSAIAALADAVRRGAATEVMEHLAAGGDEIDWIDPDDDDAPGRLEEVLRGVAGCGAEMAAAAGEDRIADALAAARRTKVLAATRHGELGLHDWTARISSAVAATSTTWGGHGPTRRRWYAGRPVIITRNDPVLRVANGDTGVVVERIVGGAPSFAVAVDLGGEHRLVAASRLDHVEDWWAMTIHRSQGSEFDHVVVSLPRRDSPVLSRELLYTALTRARVRVTVVASRGAVERAVGRPANRASGLRERLLG